MPADPLTIILVAFVLLVASLLVGGAIWGATMQTRRGKSGADRQGDDDV